MQSRFPLHTDVPVGTCIYAMKTGRIKTGLDMACVSEKHHGYYQTTENTSPISPTRHRLLVSRVRVCPRVRCASSEQGSGYCPASTPRTAPVKTDVTLAVR